MTSSKQSLELDLSFNMTKQAQELIEKHQLVIDTDTRKHLVAEFYDFLNIQALLGNYLVQGLVGSLCVVAIVIIILASLVREVDGWVYALYACVGLVVIVLSAFFGYHKTKMNRARRRKRITAYVIRKLVFWSQMKLEKEQDLKARRIIFENLMNCLFDYSKFDRDSFNKDIHLHHQISDIINSPRNFAPLLLVLHLFKLVFFKLTNRYDERGVLVLMKILGPVLTYSTNDVLNNAIHDVIRGFVDQTKINFYTSKLKLISLDPNERIVLSRNHLSEYEIEFELFQDIWKLPMDVRINHQTQTSNLRMDSKDIQDNSVSFVNRNLNIPNYIVNKKPSKFDAVDLEMRLMTDEVLFKNGQALAQDGKSDEGNAHTAFDPDISGQPNIHKSGVILIGVDAAENEDLENDDVTPDIIKIEDLNIQARETHNSKLPLKTQIHSMGGRPSVTQIKKIEVLDSKEVCASFDDAVTSLLKIESEPEENFKVMIKNSKMAILRKTEEDNPLVLIKSVSIVDGPAEKYSP